MLTTAIPYNVLQLYRTFYGVRSAYLATAGLLVLKLPLLLGDRTLNC